MYVIQEILSLDSYTLLPRCNAPHFCDLQCTSRKEVGGGGGGGA